MRIKTLAVSLLCLGTLGTAEARTKRKISLNAFVDHGLAQEAAAVERFHLTRFIDQDQLKRAIDQKLVRPMPRRGQGFYLGPLGTHASKNRSYYAYTRPFTQRFLFALGKQYAKQFHDAFRITSLVRTCRYQQRIAKSGNDNAATCATTSHTSGAAVDISVPSVARKARPWMRAILKSLEARDVLQATEEHGQPVFHVMVFPTYPTRSR